jgi:hypothetical protein
MNISTTMQMAHPWANVTYQTATITRHMNYGSTSTATLDKPLDKSTDEWYSDIVDWAYPLCTDLGGYKGYTIDTETGDYLCVACARAELMDKLRYEDRNYLEPLGELPEWQFDEGQLGDDGYPVYCMNCNARLDSQDDDDLIRQVWAVGICLGGSLYDAVYGPFDTPEVALANAEACRKDYGNPAYSAEVFCIDNPAEWDGDIQSPPIEPPSYDEYERE